MEELEEDPPKLLGCKFWPGAEMLPLMTDAQHAAAAAVAVAMTVERPAGLEDSEMCRALVELP